MDWKEPNSLINKASLREDESNNKQKNERVQSVGVIIDLRKIITKS
jgi:hypothetical protein